MFQATLRQGNGHLRQLLKGQRQVLRLICDRLTVQEIAEPLALLAMSEIETLKSYLGDRA